MKGKRKRKLAKTQAKYNEQLRQINKIIDDYLWKNKPSKECMERIVNVVYEIR